MQKALHTAQPLWGLVVFVFQGTCCYVVLLATGGWPTFREGGGNVWEVPCSREKGFHCLAWAAPGRANHRAPCQVQLKPALNLTTDITITDPENGIRGGYTSCWRRHLHETNLSTLQMLCQTPPMRKHNQQWASFTWHTKAAQLNTNQFLNLLHDTGSFKSGI